MPAIARLFFGNMIFAVALVAAFLPTLVTKRIIYGSYCKVGLRASMGMDVPVGAEGVFFRRPWAF